LRWFFFVCKRLIAWQAQKQQLRGQRQEHQQRELRQQLRVQLELPQQERGREQRLLLSYRKQPKQRQRSELPKRETCSFVITLCSELTKQFPEIA
jgi:hypothetical protein